METDFDLSPWTLKIERLEAENNRMRDVLRQIADMKREDLYLADSELPIDNAAAWTAKNALAETSQ